MSITTFGTPKTSTLFDYSSYPTFIGRYVNSSTPVKAVGTNEQAIYLSGKGYIDNIYIKQFCWYNTYEIYIDGVFLMRGGHNSSSEFSLIATTDYFKTIYDSGASTHFNPVGLHYMSTDNTSNKPSFKATWLITTQLLAYKNTDGAKEGVCVLQEPIRFNKSFEIRVIYNDATLSSSAVSICWHGGLTGNVVTGGA